MYIQPLLKSGENFGMKLSILHKVKSKYWSSIHILCTCAGKGVLYRKTNRNGGEIQ